MKRNLLFVLLMLLSVFCITGCGKSDSMTNEEKQEIYEVAVDEYGFAGEYQDWQKLIKEAEKNRKKKIQLRIYKGNKIQWSYVEPVSWNEIFSIDDITGFNRLEFTVTFDINAEYENGETPVIPDQKVLEEDTVKEPKIAERENYKLVGWYNQDTNKKWNFQSDPIYDDLNLVAKWAKNTYSLTFFPENGSKKIDVDLDFDKELTQNLLPKVKKDGYTFAGWAYKATNELVELPVKISENTNFVALWNIKKGDYIVEELKTGATINGYKIIEYVGNEKDLVIPETIEDVKVLEIGSNIFKNNANNITSIVLNDLITKVGKEAFIGCTNLKSVDFKNASEFGDDIFASNKSTKQATSLETITIKNNGSLVKMFGNDEKLMPNTLKNLNVVFNGSDKLLKDMLLANMPTKTLNVNLVGEWNKIRENEFEGTSVESINIPATVSIIEAKAFNNCLALSKIEIAPENEVYDCRDNSNAIIRKADNVLIVGCATTVIPTSVTEIADFAFFGCKDIKTINVPKNITKIGEYAFANCISLTSVTIEDGVKTIGRNAFHYCLKLESITLPNTITVIDREVFKNCISLKTIVVPEGVTEIGYYTFYECESLQTISLPSTLEKIAHSAFRECRSLTNITIPEKVTSIDFAAFKNCKKLKEINCEIASQPATWNANWNTDKIKVNWDSNNDGK